MDVAVMHHGWDELYILGLESLDDPIVALGIHMDDHEVIYLPPDSVLLAIDHLVGDTTFVQADIKSPTGKVL